MALDVHFQALKLEPHPDPIIELMYLLKYMVDWLPLVVHAALDAKKGLGF